MIGQRLGAFVRPGQVPEVWAGVAGLFRDYGYRRLRHRARIKFLVADWGPEKFREVLEKEYLGLRAAGRPAAGRAARRDPRPRGRAPAARRAATSGSRRRSAACRPTRSTSSPSWPPGTAAAGCAPPPSRRWSSSTCRRSAPRSWSTELDAAGLPARPSAFRRHTMACTGIEFCKLAIVETKARAADLIAELERRLPDFDTPVTINVNGCPNSCARIQTADIGLKGSLVTGPGRASRSRASRSTWAAA